MFTCLAFAAAAWLGALGDLSKASDQEQVINLYFARHSPTDAPGDRLAAERGELKVRQMRDRVGLK